MAVSHSVIIAGFGNQLVYFLMNRFFARPCEQACRLMYNVDLLLSLKRRGCMLVGVCGRVGVMWACPRLNS
jgi:hypothetical protein